MVVVVVVVVVAVLVVFNVEPQVRTHCCYFKSVWSWFMEREPLVHD